MSTISQQQRNGPRRAFGKVINNNITPKKKAAKGGASIADEVHSAKKDNLLFSSMATRSSKKRAASLREADDKDVVVAAEMKMGTPAKVLKTSAVEPATAAAAVLPKTAANTPLKGGEESATSQEVFRSRPEEEMDSAFWDEMEDLLEIKLANPIRSCSEDEFDLKSSSDDEDEQDNQDAAGGGGDV
jgi:PAB1-binding protein PBP1